MLASKMKQNLKGQDKLKHSKYVNIIFIVFFVIHSIITHNPFLSLLAAFIVLLSAAFSKELYDKYVKKTFIDWYDIVAAFIPYFIVEKINKNE